MPQYPTGKMKLLKVGSGKFSPNENTKREEGMGGAIRTGKKLKKKKRNLRSIFLFSVILTHPHSAVGKRIGGIKNSGMQGGTKEKERKEDEEARGGKQEGGGMKSACFLILAPVNAYTNSWPGSGQVLDLGDGRGGPSGDG